MKYPFDQNSPPHNIFFTSGALRNISIAVILFTVLAIFVGLYVGTDWMRN
jgi:hypothetical protein